MPVNVLSDKENDRQPQKDHTMFVQTDEINQQRATDATRETPSSLLCLLA